MTRASMQYDVVIVGGGPAGLSAAIKLRQLSQEISVCVIEKGSEIGAQILSGVVIDPCVLNELIPDWKEKGAPLYTQTTRDIFLFLGKEKSFRVPNWILPKEFNNQGCYPASLGNLCRWLAEQATQLGVEIYPGFAAAEVLYHDNGKVKGIATGDMGVAKDGSHKPEYSEGMDLFAKFTLFAEGCRGSLSEQLIKKFELNKSVDPQTYGIGIKELWEVKPELHQLGLVQHSAGWPLSNDVYGGSFIYHLENNQVAVGLVVGLDYKNTFLDPFEEMQRFKTHPAIRPLFIGARRVAYGARALNEGGWQSIPQLIFPGGALIGCAAGFLNVPRIKGSHNAMRSGMLAAQAVVTALKQETDELTEYPRLMQNSSVYKELRIARNFRAFFRYGLWLGVLLGGLELKLFRGRTPWTLHHKKHDRDYTELAEECKKIVYPKHDEVVTFGRMSSVFLANTRHDENQPNHLKLRDPEMAIRVCYKEYDSPEQRYCPAGVYEIVKDAEDQPHLQINAANCVHCKTCDIKDPTDNIVWTVPEGGSGPNYPNM